MINCACFTRYRTQFLSVFLALFRGARAKDGSREQGRRTPSYEPNSAHKKKKGAAGERWRRNAGWGTMPER